MAKFLKDRRNKKEFSEKRMSDIVYFLNSIAKDCNPNIRPVMLLNPIKVDLLYSELKSLQEEMETVEINYKNICIENIFESGKVCNDTEYFIKSFNNFGCTMMFNASYTKLKGDLELEVAYPRVEREKRKLELECQIEKIIKSEEALKKISPSLLGTKKKERAELERELAGLVSSLEGIKTKEQLTNEIYWLGVSYLDWIRNNIAEKLYFIEGIVEELGGELE